MNEISNLCTGACLAGKGMRGDQGFGFNPVSPPYAINNYLQKAPLNTSTLDMDCNHYQNLLEYNTHNLYGK